MGPDDSSDSSSSSSGGSSNSDTNASARRFSEKRKAAFRAAGSSLSSSGQSMMDSARDSAASHIGPVQYRKGGKVRKTGPAIVHKGERVIPRGKVKRVEKMMKRKKMRMKARS